MKYFLYALIAIAVALFGFNTTQVNYNALFSEENKVVFITILASLCVIILALILLVSKAIEQKHKKLNN